MSSEIFIKEIEYLTDLMLSENPEFFRVNIRIKPTNNVKVYVDGDNGVSIENCIRFNRKLYKMIEEKNIFPGGDFSLEVSSPGIDEPLKFHRQYKKNIGRNVQIVFNDASVKDGKLLEVTDKDIFIEQTEGKGKKVTTHQLVIPIINIKTITVQIKF